eukprot:2436059-Prymnesium_polylepis.1
MPGSSLGSNKCRRACAAGSCSLWATICRRPGGGCNRCFNLMRISSTTAIAGAISGCRCVD